MPGAEAEIDQLARATLDIFRRGAVVEYEQGIGASEEEAGHPQPVLDLMLQAVNNKDLRVAVHEAFVCSILDKCGAEEHDVVKLAPEGAPQLVQKILCLTEIRGPHDQGVEWQLSGVHASLYLCVGALPSGSCVGGAGALASSLCISSKDFTLGFVGGAGFG